MDQDSDVQVLEGFLYSIDNDKFTLRALVL